MAAPVLSAGVVIVRPDAGGPWYLLLRAYRYWDFPKGRIEPGEDALAAACREAREETGLAGLRFPWGPAYHETPRYRGKVARYYIAVSGQGEPELPVSPELGRPEHHEYRWLRCEQARVLLVPRVRAVLDWAHGLCIG